MFPPKRGFSEEVVDTMLSARKLSTRALYSAKWKKFCDWCGERAINPTLADEPVVVNFYNIYLFWVTNIQLLLALFQLFLSLFRYFVNHP